MPPPFNVPSSIGVNARARLKKVGLIELFENNREDFIAFEGLFYALLSNAQPTILTNDPNTGFNAYCTLLMAVLFAAPTMTMRLSVDSSGHLANLFGELICDHLTPRHPIQDWYGPRGDDEMSIVWNVQREFMAFLAIEAFTAGVDQWKAKQLKAAEDRIWDLRTAKRKFIPVPPANYTPFGKTKPWP